jgi:hypothetical protein
LSIFVAVREGITVYNESFTQSFRVVSLKDMQYSLPRTSTRVLGVGTIFEVDEESECLHTLWHHVDCPFKAVDKLLNLSWRGICILSRWDEIQTRS